MTGLHTQCTTQNRDFRSRLTQLALEARKNAYAPYSDFKVGAALLCADDSVFTGCNIENAAYGTSMCAERTAFFSAVCAGKRDFKAIAIAGGRDAAEEDCPPCGVCRQVMAEFCRGDFEIILGHEDGTFTVHTLSGLLPHSFGPSALT